MATVGTFSQEVSVSQAPLRSYRLEHGFWRPLGHPEEDETQKEDVRPLASPTKPPGSSGLQQEGQQAGGPGEGQGKSFPPSHAAY